MLQSKVHNQTSMKTLGIIFVSDRILNGKTENNSFRFLIDSLNGLEYDLKKIIFIKDNEGIISHELGNLFKECDVVIVVGELEKGKIFKALANLTGQELVKNDKFLKEVKIPTAVRFLTENELKYPVFHYQTIFLLEESLVEEQFTKALKKKLEYYRLEPVFVKKFSVQLNGGSNEMLEYSKRNNVNFKCEENEVSVESSDFESVVECERFIRNKLDNVSIKSHEGTNTLNGIYESLDPHVKQALEDVEKCLALYGPDNVFVSFNGGKDCTVLLHLVHAALRVKYPQHARPIFCVYVKSENAFPEQDEFISQCRSYFDLEVMSLTMGMKDALRKVLSERDHLKACFLGTRRTDPYSKDMKVFQVTDSDWPSIMRVSPLLDWHYSDVWDYLNYYKVPYCKLYDFGFTSLGNALNTIRNPCLLYCDPESGKDVYLPAYKMLDESKERFGRNVGKN